MVAIKANYGVRKSYLEKIYRQQGHSCIICDTRKHWRPLVASRQNKEPTHREKSPHKQRILERRTEEVNRKWNRHKRDTVRLHVKQAIRCVITSKSFAPVQVDLSYRDASSRRTGTTSLQQQQTMTKSKCHIRTTSNTTTSELPRISLSESHFGSHGGCCANTFQCIRLPSLCGCEFQQPRLPNRSPDAVNNNSNISNRSLYQQAVRNAHSMRHWQTLAFSTIILGQKRKESRNDFPARPTQQQSMKPFVDILSIPQFCTSNISSGHCAIQCALSD